MRKFFVDIIMILLFAGLTALGAAVQLPFLPYHPFTLQIISPLLAGSFLGKEKGALSQIVFIFLGVINLPLFNLLAFSFPVPSLGASPQFTRLSLRAGYLLGFVAAAYLIGKTVEEKKPNQFPPILLTMLSAVILIYTMALANFRLVFGIPLSGPFFDWAIPFFLLDLAKALFAALMYWRLRASLSDETFAQLYHG